MQRACPLLLLRKVQLTCITTRLLSGVRLPSAHRLLRNRVVMHSTLNFPCHQYATQPDEGILQRFRNLIGLGKLSKSMSRTVGYKLYQSMDQVDHNIFLKKLNMDDTFHSWFIVRSLHVWMLMARLMNDGDKGRLVRNSLVSAMWDDVEAKSKQLGETASSVRRKQIQGLVDEFQASLFSYDEGLMSDDSVLAGAIWRNIFSQGDFDPRHLEVLVDYVRENIATLDKISYDELYKSKVNWTKIRL